MSPAAWPSLPRCACGSPAAVFLPGHARACDDGVLMLRDRPVRAWCLPHAIVAGWPWLPGGKRQRGKRRAAG